MVSKFVSCSEYALNMILNVSLFPGQPESCCATSTSNANSACFTADSVELESPDFSQRCLPTLEVMRPDLEVVKRCVASADCTDGNVCIALREDQHIIRISFVEHHDAIEEKRMVWNGPPEELLEDSKYRLRDSQPSQTI